MTPPLIFKLYLRKHAIIGKTSNKKRGCCKLVQQIVTDQNRNEVIEYITKKKPDNANQSRLKMYDNKTLDDILLRIQLEENMS